LSKKRVQLFAKLKDPALKQDYGQAFEAVDTAGC
jgi:hypothetical protein